MAGGGRDVLRTDRRDSPGQRRGWRDGAEAGRAAGRMRGRLAWLAGIVAIAVAFGGPGQGDARAAGPRQAVVLTIDGAIDPASADYAVRGIAAAKPADTAVIVLRMDTPGGLDTSMRAIIRAILASPVPVVAYVAPSGARAASAGTYIAYACPIAAMAPGTNLGAATPIAIGGLPGRGNGTARKEPGEPASTEARKMLNDAMAYIRSLAELNGRNEEWAVEAVRGAASLSAAEALKLHVIDVIADDVPDLLLKIDGRIVKVDGKSEMLATAGLQLVPIQPGWRTRFLSIITDPSVAYLLMLLGAYGLIFELMSPGAVLPGTIGAISLIVALFGLDLLPIDYAGVGLVLVGIGMMVAEAVIGAFGVIGVGGVIAFGIGSVLMFRGGMPGFGLPVATVLAATVASAAFFLLALAMLLRARRRPVVTGGEALIGAEARVISWQGMKGTVRVAGEVWQARGAAAFAAGDAVTVEGRENLVLVVAPGGSGEGRDRKEKP